MSPLSPLSPLNDFNDLRRRANAGSLADTPSSTRRTFDWLSIGLPTGAVARAAEGDYLSFRHRDISAHGPTSGAQQSQKTPRWRVVTEEPGLSPDLQTRHGKPGTPLTLSTPAPNVCRMSARYAGRSVNSLRLRQCRLLKPHSTIGGFRAAIGFIDSPSIHLVLRPF